jgi:hypothetical protein
MILPPATAASGRTAKTNRPGRTQTAFERGSEAEAARQKRGRREAEERQKRGRRGKPEVWKKHRTPVAGERDAHVCRSGTEPQHPAAAAPIPQPGNRCTAVARGRKLDLMRMRRGGTNTRTDESEEPQGRPCRPCAGKTLADVAGLARPCDPGYDVPAAVAEWVRWDARSRGDSRF